MKARKILLFAVLALALLAGPVAQVYSSLVTAIRVGGHGGGGGTVTFTIDNTDGSLPMVSLQATVASDDEIKEITGTPLGWIASSIVMQNGKGVSVTWSTSTNPVPAGGTLSGFSVRMMGQSPYVYNWVLTNTSGGTVTGSVTVI